MAAPPPTAGWSPACCLRRVPASAHVAQVLYRSTPSRPTKNVRMGAAQAGPGSSSRPAITAWLRPKAAAKTVVPPLSLQSWSGYRRLFVPVALDPVGDAPEPGRPLHRPLLAKAADTRPRWVGRHQNSVILVYDPPDTHRLAESPGKSAYLLRVIRRPERFVGT